MTDTEPFGGLEARLSYRFADPAHLTMALTHKSAAEDGGANNERLEFLGDRVLGLAVADMLLARFPEEPEGGLSKRLVPLVRKEALAEVAREWELGPILVMSDAEIAEGGRAKAALLADAVEAVLGAVYLDGGYEPARDLVGRVWSARIDAVADLPRDAKTTLQEWSLARGLGLPAYREVARHGPDHAPAFVVEVEVAPHPAERAEGRSKRTAEKAAAARLLARLEATGP